MYILMSNSYTVFFFFFFSFTVFPCRWFLPFSIHPSILPSILPSSLPFSPCARTYAHRPGYDDTYAGRTKRPAPGRYCNPYIPIPLHCRVFRCFVCPVLHTPLSSSSFPLYSSFVSLCRLDSTRMSCVRACMHACGTARGCVPYGELYLAMIHVVPYSTLDLLYSTYSTLLYLQDIRELPIYIYSTLDTCLLGICIVFYFIVWTYDDIFIIYIYPCFSALHTILLPTYVLYLLSSTLGWVIIIIMSSPLLYTRVLLEI